MKKVEIEEEAGLTLLELMLASGVMVTTLAMLFGSLLSVSLVGEIAEQREVAVSHIASVMETMRTTPLNELPSMELPPMGGLGCAEVVQIAYINESGEAVVIMSGSPDPYGDTLGDMDGEDGGQTTGEFDPTVLPNPLELQVTIDWVNSQGHPATSTASMVVGR